MDGWSRQYEYEIIRAFFVGFDKQPPCPPDFGGCPTSGVSFRGSCNKAYSNGTSYWGPFILKNYHFSAFSPQAQGD